jgi:glycine cleavage system regulatory protein
VFILLPLSGEACEKIAGEVQKRRRAHLKISWLRGETPRNKELLLNELDIETNRKADIVGSLTDLSTRWTLWYSAESGGLATAVFFRSFFT